ncbi:STAS domain-containing protein [Modestobacter sp. URMC 112]
MVEPQSAPRDEDRPPSDTHAVTVTCTREGQTARIEVVGELTDAARRPLVRELTDLMLGKAPLKRVELDVTRVSFLNSAGIAALVQLQKMVQPRGITLVLEVASDGVARPLQLSGLWHRFTVLDRRPDTAQATHEPLDPGHQHS